MKHIFTCLIVLAALNLSGCLALGIDGIGNAPQTWFRTAKGTRVLIMDDWLTDPVLIQQALEEIDSTKPVADFRISPDVVGAPKGIAVVIRPPGPYPFKSGQAPGGYASGHTDMYSYVHCAWKWLDSQKMLLPALGAEYRHAYTKDLWAGHKRDK